MKTYTSNAEEIRVGDTMVIDGKRLKITKIDLDGAKAKISTRSKDFEISYDDDIQILENRFVGILRDE